MKRFSASNAAMLMACPASGNLPAAIPNWTEPVVDDTVGAKSVGHKYHEILAELMELPARDLKMMIEAQAYVAKLRSKRRFKVLIEESIEAWWLQTKPTTTVDLVLYTQDEIHVIDWKTGKIPVDVHGNEQLKYYGLAFSPLAPKAKGVHIHVVQPWADNMEMEFISSVELGQFMQDTIEAEKKLLAGDTTFGPSDHCTFCPANPHSRGDKGAPLCPAMMQVLYPKLDVDEDAMLNDI